MRAKSPSSLQALLAPKSIAIVGASADPKRIGGRPISYMQQRGYKGEIFPVNPSRKDVQGLTCFSTISELPSAPDVGIIAVPGAAVAQALEELGAIGTRAAIIFSAGFAETGSVGAVAQSQLLTIADRHGMRVLGPNCLGLFNDSIGYYATFAGAFQAGWPIAGGRVGFVSQSGAYGMHLFVAARDRGIGTSLVCTTGNEADITIGEVIAAMVVDATVDCIAVFAEGIRNPTAFVDALAQAREAKKPVVVMKVGRTSLGRSAAASHTGALATDDRVFQAVLDEFGVVRADTSEQLLDVAHLATRRIFPSRRSLGVLTISGGAGVLASDAATMVGLSMPQLDPVQQKRFTDLIPFCSAQNPVDLTGQVGNDPSLIAKFAQLLSEQDEFSSIFGFLGQIGGFRSELIRSALRETSQLHPDKLIVLSVAGTPAQIASYEEDGFICISDPTRAVFAIAAMCRFGEAFARCAERALEAPAKLSVPSSSVNESEAKRLLRNVGVTFAPEMLCHSAAEAALAAAELGFPVVLKIVSPDLMHKSDIGGVLVNIIDAASVRSGFKLLQQRGAAALPGSTFDGVLVAHQITGGIECIMGVQRDPTFGLVAMFGLGGIFVEVLSDVIFRRCPFNEEVAKEMILQTKAASVLVGARGGQPRDIDALAHTLAALSSCATSNDLRLKSIELNPIFAMPEGRGAIAVDAVIEVQSTVRDVTS